MSDHDAGKVKKRGGTKTKHGTSTPEVSRAADEEMAELLKGGNEVGSRATKKDVDKTELGLPKELDH